MNAPRKIWVDIVGESTWMHVNGSQKYADDALYHHDDVVRELKDALTKIADTNVWGQSMHHALNARIRIATDALAKIEGSQA